MKTKKFTSILTFTILTLSWFTVPIFIITNICLDAFHPLAYPYYPITTASMVIFALLLFYSTYRYVIQLGTFNKHNPRTLNIVLSAFNLIVALLFAISFINNRIFESSDIKQLSIKYLLISKLVQYGTLSISCAFLWISQAILNAKDTD